MPKRFGSAGAWVLAVVAFLTLGLLWGPAVAQRSVVPPPQGDEVILMPGRVVAPPPVRDVIKLKNYDVSVAIDNNVAVTTIEQTFVNQSGRTVEAKYLYPLPPDANFSSFTLMINGKPVEGKLMEKDTARKTYYDIVQRLIDPGLLEFVDSQTVQVSVAPIAPGEEKQIKLSYTQLLAQDGGLYKYQYRFGNTVGSPMAADNARLDLKLNTPEPLKTVYSPTHSPKVNRSGQRQASLDLNLNETKNLAEKSFVLYYSQDNQAVSLNSLVYKEPAAPEGYFLMTIRAPQALTQSKPLPKSLVLVLDTSGSMSGDKIMQAKEALKTIVNRLRPEDTFNIVQFNTDVSLFKQERMAATPENKRAALDYVNTLQADGSTNIEGALKAGFGLVPVDRAQRPGYVIFLTDGEPTVGVTDTPGLLDIAKQANTGHARLFNFGVGYDVKTDLLGKLAEAHHGSTTYVEPGENLEVALNSFYSKIEAPVLTDARLDFGPFKVAKVYPAELGDLFAGSEVVLLGRYAHGGSGQVQLTGKVGAQTRTFSYPVQWQDRPATQHASLPRLWAGRRIGYLLDNIHQNGESPEVKDEVIALSKQYGIVTPYTSFLALEPEGKAAESTAGGSALPRQKAARLPASAPMASMDSYRANKGQGAVQLQKSLSRMQQQASAADMAEAQVGAVPGTTLGVQTVGKKTFALSPTGVWTDTAYDAARDGKPRQVTFGSPEYFKLLSDVPALAPFFSLGQQVLVVLDGVVYEVVAPKTT